MTDKPEDDISGFDLSTSAGVHGFALALETAGQEAVAKAIANHKVAGNPIYYRDPFNGGPLIKEMPDGRRFAVVFSDNGNEAVLKELVD